MDMKTIGEALKDETYVRRVEGRTRAWNIGNRVYGALGVTLATMPMWHASWFTQRVDSPSFSVAFGLAVAYCTADILTGHHHYCIHQWDVYEHTREIEEKGENIL